MLQSGTAEAAAWNDGNDAAARQRAAPARLLAVSDHRNQWRLRKARFQLLHQVVSIGDGSVDQRQPAGAVHRLQIFDIVNRTRPEARPDQRAEFQQECIICGDDDGVDQTRPRARRVASTWGFGDRCTH